MKKVLYIITISLMTVLSVSAQKTRTIPAGEITANTTWYKDTMYTLDGYIYVKNATLTIQAGTIVRGGDPAKKSSLVITRTGKLNAIGTASQPIVFTSGKAAGQRAPGDWGGIVLLGQAVINRPTDCSTCPGTAVASSLPGIQNAIEGDLDNANGDGLYGGNDNNHSSGTLAYIRLEYGGVVITPGNEINGLTLGGVGSGTTLHHIQVTQANDDGFEWFGGNVDAKYLVSNRNIDDDLDTDFGFTGRVQYAVVIRDSSWYDIGSGPTTNGFESDNDGSGTEATPYTNATFSNITVVGPLANGTALSSPTSFQNGLRIRRNSSMSLFNSIVMGWPAGLFVDGTRTGEKFVNDSMMFRNNILAGNLTNVNASSANATAVRTKVVAGGTDTTFAASSLLTNPFYYTAPNFLPLAGSGALSGASFTTAPRISDAFFTPTTYRGAMGTDDWTQCWCNFDPQNTNYNNGPINNAPVYDAGNDSTICAGKSISIGKVLTGTLKATWSPSTGLNNVNAAMPTASPLTTTKYYVTIKDTVSGCSMLDSITVTVTPNPVADFTSANGTNGTVNFTSTSTGATSYVWNFGNGATSAAQNPSNTYTSNGTYSVSLTTTNGTCANTITKLVTVTGINSPTRAITGDITTNTTWYRDTIYTMNGYVYVKNANLTIESGTIVKGGANRGTLVITRTGKLFANGTKNQPIVFTSNKAIGSRAPGDWGGIVLLGQAVINRPTDCSTCPGTAVAATIPGIQNAIEGDLDNAAGDGLYGGNDNNHSSGSLTYIRLEFGGVVITPGNEINGLTMGGVGKGTTIHHIQVTQANDDGFEWFGGNVDARYLISNRNIDDDLDTDFGFTGRVQHALVLRDSSWYDIGTGPTTNGFESDNDGSGTEATPYTDATFSNITVVGPLANGTALSSSTSFQNGLRIRRNSSMSLFNSIVMGWPAGLYVDGDRSGNKFATDSLLFNNNILAGNLINVNASSKPSASVVLTKILASGSDTMSSANGLLVNPFDYNNPNFTPVAGSAATSGASFTSATRISDAFFRPTTYRGAMDVNPDSNWTNCWCRFDPQNENYTSAPVNYPASLASFSLANPSGRTVNFTNNSSLATSYAWDFGVTGSTTDTSSEMSPSFIYPANGTYVVTLTAKSICGNSVKTETVVINDQSSNPIANFSFAQSTGTGTNDFTFTNTSDEKGFTTTYLWDFGVSSSTTDTSTAKNPTFTFPASGVYDVKLVAIGQFGSDSITKTITAFSVNVKEVSTTINHISLFPNPTSGIVNVNFNTSKSEAVTIFITDISGRIVKSIPTTTYNSGMNNVIMDASDLNNGLYFVSIRSTNFNKTTRLLIAK
jgi:PKD repeat protein